MSQDRHMERVPKEDVSTSSYSRIFPKGFGTSTMEASRRPESSSASSSRSNGHPFKRNAVGNNGAHENGLHKAEYTRKGDWLRLVLKSRELTSRAVRPPMTEKGNRSFNKAWLYVITLVVTACFFAAEAFVQGSRGSILKGTAAAASEALTVNRFYELSGKALSSEEVLEYKVKFVPWKLKERFMRQRLALDQLRKLQRSSFRRPRLALVCVDLETSPDSLYMFTVWIALESLGYELEVFSIKDGPMHNTWEQNGAFVTILQPDFFQLGYGVDWLKFEGVLLSTLDAKAVSASLLQDPFKGVPVIWILHEDSRGKDLLLSRLMSEFDALSSYRRTFERADVVLLSDYALAMKYSQFDTGNFFVLPGSPIYEWEAEDFMSMHTREEVRGALNLSVHDIAVAVVGSPFSYKSAWREHAIIMQAILPLVSTTQNGGFSIKLFFWSVGSVNGYNRALQIMAAQIGLANGSVSHFGTDRDLDKLLWAADVIVYSSLREEQAFPSTLLKAIVFGHPIVAPNITVIRDNIRDGIHGYVFRAGDTTDLERAFKRAFSQSGVIGRGHVTAMHSRGHSRGLLIAKTILGFSDLLEAVIEFPSEAHLPLPVSSLSKNLLKDWQWQLLEVSANYSKGQTNRVSLDGAHQNERSSRKFGSERRDLTAKIEEHDGLTFADWADFRVMRVAEEMEQSEEEQLKERNEQLHGTWEEVYRSVRKAENMKNDLHEREDGELERTGQPICVYEPYIGPGTWPLLGQKSMMYRGISLIAKQRRLGSDDIEAPMRLPLLNHSYYRDVLCEFGAFFAIANRIDRIHKNAWIGFQSWQAAGRKVSLSGKAESVLYDAVKGRNSGDIVYFWASLDLHSNQKSRQRDFWSFCDAINNGNCRQVFLRTFKEMFGLPPSWSMLPPMPVDGDRWSALHSWAMPTSSFLEFIMFSRMFVSALDSFYLQHGKCNLGGSTFEVQHCYCRLLELLINVWAYHSGRTMVFLDPDNGLMHEQHNLSSRHGHMWINFFSYETFKGMDADLAEEADDGSSANKGWLWPRTGEVYCQQIHERERKQRYAMKLEKKKRDKERVRRIRSRQRQQPLARG
eukprot:c23159_g1_i1 orf=709-3948(-)